MDGVIVEMPELDVFGQMAIDDALARSPSEAFNVRFFRWRGVGATFGYAQRISEVEQALPAGIGRFFTRRPTGGGIVPHLDDLTFSCVFPEDGAPGAAVLYRRLHSAVLAGLRETGAEARLCAKGGSPAPRGPEGASRCFEKPVALDILADGKKILGGAIRRHGRIVLYQGSLQLPGVRNRSGEFEAAILRGLAAEWGLTWTRREPDAAVRAEAAAVEPTYRSREWIRKL